MNQFSLKNKIHIKGNQGGAIYLPLCAKPAFVKLINKHEDLLEDCLRHCLATTKADVLVFIADGDVMTEAVMATETASRAQRVVAALSVSIRDKVDAAIGKVNDARIKGVVHWEDVASTERFKTVMGVLENFMAHDVDDSLGAGANFTDGIMRIQHHVKTLVKNLFTQRVEKARAAGCAMTNVFTGKGLSMVPGARYRKWYQHLERACLLELSAIMVGLQHGAQMFTEMRYLTNDPRGMTYIAGCMQNLRQTIAGLSSGPSTVLLKSATEMHGITFMKFKENNSFTCK